MKILPCLAVAAVAGGAAGFCSEGDDRAGDQGRAEEGRIALQGAFTVGVHGRQELRLGHAQKQVASNGRKLSPYCRKVAGIAKKK